MKRKKCKLCRAESSKEQPADVSNMIKNMEREDLLIGEMFSVHNPKKSNRFLLLFTIILIIFLGYLAYSNSFKASFQADDLFYIVHNELLHNYDLLSLWNKFASRIVVFFSLYVNYYFGGLNVFGYHLFNFIVHILVAINVFWLVLLLYRTPALQKDQINPLKNTVLITAAFASFIFVTHPIQTQAVTYIWQRATSLAALFYLLSMNLFLKSEILLKKGKRIWVFFAGLAFCSGILANFTKQNAFTLPFIIFILWFLFFKDEHQKINHVIKRLAGWFMLLFITPIMTIIFRSQELIDIQRGTGGGLRLSSLEYFYTQINVVRNYLSMLILPFNQKLDYDFPLSFSLFEVKTILSLILHFSLGYIAIYYRKKRPLISFCIIFFYLALAVESSFIPLMDVIFEHRLYLPSVGFFIFASWSLVNLLLKYTGNGFFEKFESSKIVIIILILGFLCYPLIHLSKERNEVWATPHSLWKDNAAKTPNKPRPNFKLANIYKDKGDIDKALFYFKKADELGFKGHDAKLNIGVLYGSLGQFQKSIDILEELVKEFPEEYDIFLNLGSSYANQKNIDKAIYYYQKAISLSKGELRPYILLARAYCDNNQIEEGIDLYQKLLKDKELKTEQRIAIADDLYRLCGEPELAEKTLKNALECSTAKKGQGESLTNIHFRLAQIYINRGDLENAERHLIQAKSTGKNLPKEFLLSIEKKLQDIKKYE